MQSQMKPGDTFNTHLALCDQKQECHKLSYKLLVFLLKSRFPQGRTVFQLYHQPPSHICKPVINCSQMSSKQYSPAVRHMMLVPRPLGKCCKFENHWRSSVARGSQVPGIPQQSGRSQLLFDCYHIELLPTVHQLCLQRDGRQEGTFIINCMQFINV